MCSVNFTNQPVRPDTGYPNPHGHLPPPPPQLFTKDVAYSNSYMNQPPRQVGYNMAYSNSYMNQPPPQVIHNDMENPNLLTAALKGDIEFIKGCPLDLDQQIVSHELRNTTLHAHIKYSDTPSPVFVEQILDMFPSLLRQVNVHGDTPLHFAAERGHSAIAEVLLNRIDNGEEIMKMINMTNDNKETALDKAVKNAKIGVLKTLIRKAEPSSLDLADNFSKILGMAAREGDREMLDAVAAKGQDVMTGFREALMGDDFEGNAKGNTLLHVAAKGGNSAVVEFLLDRVRDQPQEEAESGERANTMTLINKKNSKGKTAVHKAARYGNGEVLKIFIKEAVACSLNFGDYFPHVILHMEAYKEQEKMDAVIAKSHDGIKALERALMKDDFEGNNTFLHSYVRSKRPETAVVEKVLDICPQLLVRVNGKGNTPLHISARRGCVDIVKVVLQGIKDQPQKLENGEIIDAKRLVSMKNKKGKTALDKALRIYRREIEVVKIIIKEADPDLLFCADNFPGILYVAAKREDEGILDLIVEKSCGRVPTLEQLLVDTVLGGDWDLCGTLLHVSIQYSTATKYLKKILELCPSLLQKDYKGYTPLHVVVACGESSAVEFLLKCARERDQSEGLERGETTYMEMLKKKNKDGKTTLDLALEFDNIQVVEMLIREAADIGFFYNPDNFLKMSNHAAERGDYKMLNVLAEGPSRASRLCKALADPAIIEKQPSKDTILHVHIKSSKKPSIEFVTKILELCPSLLRKVNDKNETPLHVASKCGHSDVVELLLKFSKPQEQESEQRDDWEMLNMENKEGSTALHEAVRHGRLEVARILIKADDSDYPFSPNQAHETPLYLAAARGYCDVVFEILSSSRPAAHQGPNKMTALHAAVMNSNTPAEQYPYGMSTSNQPIMTSNIPPEQYSNGMSATNQPIMTANVPVDTSLEIMRKILQSKESLTKAQDAYGWTPLHYAAYHGYYDKVSLLLEFDKSAAHIADNDREMTALHMAASQGHKDIIEKIISECVECCEIVDKRGWNVLHFAMLSLNKKELDDLLKNPLVGSLIDKKDNNENSPLHIRAAAYRDTFFYIGDRKAVNKEKISVEYMLKHGSHKLEEDIHKLFEDVGNGQYANCVIRDRDRKDDDCFKIRGERRKKYYDGLKETKSSHLLVATLIATVTFTAAFTIPGGYTNEKSSGSSDEGTAVLHRNLAFRTFIITDTIAMTLSLSAVFVHFLMSFEKFQRQESLLSLALWLTILAMGTVVIAFVTGIYSVLASSLWLAITTCALGLSFFLLVLCALILLYRGLFRGWLGPIWEWFKRQGTVRGGCVSILPTHLKKGN